MRNRYKRARQCGQFLVDTRLPALHCIRPREGIFIKCMGVPRPSSGLRAGQSEYSKYLFRCYYDMNIHVLAIL